MLGVDDIFDIRKNKSKPIVQNVLKCVMILLDKKVTQIAIFSEVMKNDFIHKILSFDIDTIATSEKRRK